MKLLWNLHFILSARGVWFPYLFRDFSDDILHNFWCRQWSHIEISLLDFIDSDQKFTSFFRFSYLPLVFFLASFFLSLLFNRSHFCFFNNYRLSLALDNFLSHFAYSLWIWKILFSSAYIVGMYMQYEH